MVYFSKNKNKNFKQERYSAFGNESNSNCTILTAEKMIKAGQNIFIKIMV